jgi:hypothetical protein
MGMALSPLSDRFLENAALTYQINRLKNKPYFTPEDARILAPIEAFYSRSIALFCSLMFHKI